jgi:hypothetical protein
MAEVGENYWAGPQRCERCEEPLSWELNAVWRGDRRWLGRCDSCEWFVTVVRDRVERDDPLRTFLVYTPVRERESKPWLRFFATINDGPWLVVWNLADYPCVGCDSPAVVNLRSPNLPRHRPARLCLSCGVTQLTVSDGSALLVIDGGTWIPPDSAVTSLRRMIFSAPSLVWPPPPEQ